MKRASGLVVLAVSLAAAPAFAHGEKGHGPPAGVQKRKALEILSPAKAAARVEIDAASGARFIRADGLPDHEPGRFPNAGNPHSIRQQSYTLRVPLAPMRNAAFRPSRVQPFGVALNGVLFDPGTAEFWNNDPRSGWALEAIGGPRNLGLDRSNAHVQPDGTYHYHGIPVGLLERLARRETPALLGYAADGFPIYGPFGYAKAGDPASGLRRLEPGWRMRAGSRPAGAPPGRHDGSYAQDFEFVAGAGDLDECNGREGVTPEYPQGTYHYVLTERFPFIPRCFAGTPDASFNLKGPPGGGPGGRPPPPGGPGFGPPRGPRP
ncbi:MAG: YHYH protein [Rhodospirillales bacterium]|nr:YHYH protein [Rhodospirillales bacterium]